MTRLHRLATLTLLALLGLAPGAIAQVTPASGYVPPDDTPSIRVGATLFPDYTVQHRAEDHRRRRQHVTAQRVQHRAAPTSTSPATSRTSSRSGSRPTSPARPAPGARCNGSHTYRLKYAYAQFNLDDWMRARLVGALRHAADAVGRLHRHRLPLPVPGHRPSRIREGILSSSDVGATFHYNFAGNYGDFHGGFYNGDNYNRAEANDQKAFMLRGTVRPLPHACRRCGACASPGSTTTTPTSRTPSGAARIVGLTFEHP